MIRNEGQAQEAGADHADGTASSRSHDVEDIVIRNSPDVVAALISSAASAVIAKDLEGRVLSWNQGAERIFGYSADEMIGTTMLRAIPEEVREEEIDTLRRIARGETVAPFETIRRAGDGRLITVTVATSPIRDPAGNVIGGLKIVHDITHLRQREREIARLERLYVALIQISQALVASPTRETMLAKVCDILVEAGKFPAAWIGWHDPDTQMVVPVASSADAASYLRNVRIATDGGEFGRGPASIAFHNGKPYICNDFLNDPVTLPWRDQIQKIGWRASVGFPIRQAGKICAILSVYADEPNFFQEEEIALLNEAANNLSFALDNFLREEERARAEQLVRSERDFSDAVIHSLPGILYIYDRAGRFLRWNRNFAQVSGYDDTEIAAMKPTDFFAETDQELLLSRISEVFEKGESSVEADFLSKDGSKTPYYFTGVLTEIDGADCLVGVGIDVSKRRRAEQARLEAEDATREARAALARFGRISLLGEFVASVAHEINQPLASIAANSGAATRWLARDPPDFAEAIAAVKRIRRDADRASGVIARVRALVSQKETEYHWIDMNSIVTEVCGFLAGEMRSANVQLDTDLSKNLPAVRGDVIQIQQVLANLIGNAIDAMKPVLDRPRILKVRTGADAAGELLVQITDSGIGLDPTAAERMFEHFFTTKSGGTGLGLAISRSIIDGHGGTLRAMPASPHGASFCFTIPRAKEAGQ